jgi:hypothetical protein
MFFYHIAWINILGNGYSTVFHLILVSLKPSQALLLLPHAVTDLSFQSTLYGKCIFADYNNVHKGMCSAEFMKLKECYLVRPHHYYGGL